MRAEVKPAFVPVRLYVPCFERERVMELRIFSGIRAGKRVRTGFTSERDSISAETYVCASNIIRTKRETVSRR